jgi:hypothetical protein
MNYRLAGMDPDIVSPETEQEWNRRLELQELREAGFADRSSGGTVSTPREMGGLLERMLRGELVHASCSARMLQLLESTSSLSRSMIPRFLPEDLTIAHRAGGAWRVLADAGVVDPRGRPIVMVLFAFHDPAEMGAADLLADLSRILFEWFRAPNRLRPGRR